MVPYNGVRCTRPHGTSVKMSDEQRPVTRAFAKKLKEIAEEVAIREMEGEKEKALEKSREEEAANESQ